jgi:hypothetical protein
MIAHRAEIGVKDDQLCMAEQRSLEHHRIMFEVRDEQKCELILEFAWLPSRARQR